MRQIGFVQAIPPAPMRPAKALQPAHGTYSVTFPSSAVYLEAWSRFPFSARLVEQGLRRASVPSEAEPNYVEWFKVCPHPYIAPEEGTTSGPSPSQSRVEYLSFPMFFFVFSFPVLFLVNSCFPFVFSVSIT